MKKYVYIIDYRDRYGADQMECNNMEDVYTQLKYLKEDNSIVENVKKVDVEDRYIERNISITSIRKVIRTLKYKPIFIFCNN